MGCPRRWVKFAECQDWLPSGGQEAVICFRNCVMVLVTRYLQVSLWKHGRNTFPISLDLWDFEESYVSESGMSLPCRSFNGFWSWFSTFPFFCHDDYGIMWTDPVSTSHGLWVTTICGASCQLTAGRQMSKKQTAMLSTEICRASGQCCWFACLFQQQKKSTLILIAYISFHLRCLCSP